MVTVDLASRLTFHIGASATATTSMSSNLYAQHTGILNVGRPFRDGPSRSALWDALEGRPTPYLDDLRAYCSRFGNDLQIVLCDDKIGARAAATNDMAAQLRSVFGPVRIMITIRNQLSAIESEYLKQARDSHQPFEDWVIERKERLVRRLSYHNLIASFQTEFGPANVGVFLYEVLRTDAVMFTESICSFIGVDKKEGVELMARPSRNRRLSRRELQYHRIKNRFFKQVAPSQLLPVPVIWALRRVLQRGQRADVQWPPDLFAELANAFRDDNRALSNALVLELETFGYPV